MSFVQSEFAAFLAVVLTAYWLLRRRELQNLLLVVASAVFYGWVHPWFLWLLFGSATLDFLVARGMAGRPDRKARLLAVSLVGNLGLLGWFKYCDFFIENVDAVLSALGFTPSLPLLGVALPVGISFYTFQTMSYSIDVYRGDVEPRRNYLDYLVYVSFFPQLVAGPVERASTFLTQVERERSFDVHRVLQGVSRIVWGLFKKLVVADTIAFYVDRVFVLQAPTQALIAAATVGFAIQILADFSGYTDIARGVANLLGFELVQNFDHPYLATTPSDFWRRWHISFSTWIRDYIYIPLGGSRGTFAKMTAATFGAMLLSGLWHGASWNFVLWGGYHALLITGYRLVQPRLPHRWRGARVSRPLAVGLMFVFTCAGWLIFRETHIDRIWMYVAESPTLGDVHQQIAATMMVAMVLACALPLITANLLERFALPAVRESKLFYPCLTTTWAALVYFIVIFVRPAPDAFIYFQF